LVTLFFFFSCRLRLSPPFFSRSSQQQRFSSCGSTPPQRPLSIPGTPTLAFQVFHDLHGLEPFWASFNPFFFFSQEPAGGFFHAPRIFFFSPPFSIKEVTSSPPHRRSPPFWNLLFPLFRSKASVDSWTLSFTVGLFLSQLSLVLCRLFFFLLFPWLSLHLTSVLPRDAFFFIFCTLMLVVIVGKWSWTF